MPRHGAMRYASGWQLTQITDPNSHIATINYDSAGRVSSVNRPDSTSESFTNDQEAGWTNSGTSLSPAPSTLLAVAASSYTSPNSNTTSVQPDWMGMGLPGNVIDPLGNDQLYDRDANGLATVTVDQVNRNVQYAYDSKGNPVEHDLRGSQRRRFHLQRQFTAADPQGCKRKHHQLHVQRRGISSASRIR